MKRAIVVGGSMGGLLAGNMLVRQGWQVEVGNPQRGVDGLGGQLDRPRVFFLAGSSSQPRDTRGVQR